MLCHVEGSRSRGAAYSRRHNIGLILMCYVWLFGSLLRAPHGHGGKRRLVFKSQESEEEDEEEEGGEKGSSNLDPSTQVS